MSSATLPHESLDSEIANQSIDALNLSETTLEILATHELHRIADVYDLQVEGLTLAGLDEETARYVWDEVLQYVSTPARWKQASLFEQLILSHDELPYLEGSLIDIPTLLPEYIQALFEHVKDSRRYDILVRRYGLNGSGRYTLEEIAAFYEVSRERIRQLEKKAKGILGTALLEGQAPSDHVKINNEIVSEILELVREFEQNYSIVLHKDALEYIKSRYSKESLTENEINHLELLLDICGWIKRTSLPGSYRGDINTFWIVDSTGIDLKRLGQALKHVLEVLHSEAVRVSYFDLKVQVNRRVKSHFSDFEIRTIIPLSADIESLEDDAFQIEFHRLSSTGEQAYRILVEEGIPMSFRAIHKEMATRLTRVGCKVATQRTLVGSMVNDKRMEPIGRSGQWTLIEWEDVNQENIIPLMREFFYKKGKPGKTKEVYDYVSERRPVKYTSINTYLVDNENFVRVASGLYQLSSWPLPEDAISTSVPRRKKLTWDKLADLIVQIYDEKGTDRLPIAEIVSRLLEITGRKQISYKSLQSNPAIEIYVLSENPRRLEAKVIRNYLELPGVQKRQLTMRERVHTSVRSVLKQQPDRTMQMTRLKEVVIRKTGVHTKTFYSYLSEMLDVQKAPIPGARTYMCILIQGEDEEELEVEPIQNVWEPSFVFDVAISYAGKEVHITRKFAEAIQSQGFSCFFDREQLPDLVGRNLVDDLTEIYENKAQFCLMLASQAYNESNYAQIERQAAQARAVRDNGYLVVVKLEDVPVKGMPSTQAYLDFNSYVFDELAEIVIQKLRKRLGS